MGHVEWADDDIDNDSHGRGVSAIGVPGNILEEGGQCYGISYIVVLDVIMCRESVMCLPFHFQFGRSFDCQICR